MIMHRARSNHRCVACGLPLALFGVVAALGCFSTLDSGRDGVKGALQIAAAGFVSPEVVGRNGDYAAVHSSRRILNGERELSIRVPSVARWEGEVDEAEVITISKSGARHDVDFEASRREWKYLSKSVRHKIDEAIIRPGRWQSIVVHNSATERGGARVLGYHHRHIKKLPEGLAYHFVIGNGSGSGLGEIEIGGRWARQSKGEPIIASAENNGAIGICLVGNFNEGAIDVAQLEAFDELTDYLQARVGVMELKTHADASGGEIACPGRFFPASLLTRERKGSSERLPLRARY